MATIEPSDPPTEGIPLSDIKMLAYFFENVEDLDTCLDLERSQQVSLAQSINDEEKSSAYKINEDQTLYIYRVDDKEHLVELFCGAGAYQGSYEYLLYDSNTTGIALKQLNFGVTGSTTFDTTQNILTVVLMSNGLGHCVVTRQYQWRKNYFEQINVEVKENIPGGCKALNDLSGENGNV